MANNAGASGALVKVTALTEDARRSLSSLERDQFPFALAKTLTDIAGKAVEGVKSKTRQQFNLHSEFIPRGISRSYARKSDVKNKGVGTTVVFTKPIISGWMPVHEGGGVRTANSGGGGGGTDKGKYLAIPAADLLQRAYKTGTGKTRKRWKPGTLMANYRKARNVSMSGGLTRSTRGGRKGAPFVIRAKNSGTPMIVRRKGVQRYPLELLYIFSRRSKFKPVWGFEKKVNQLVDTEFNALLRVNLDKAVRSAR